jgi:hypothetical protein
MTHVTGRRPRGHRRRHNRPVGSSVDDRNRRRCAGSDKVLLDSIVVQRADGSVLVGRGVPPRWLTAGAPIAVSNFPTTNGRRSSFTIDAHGGAVTLTITGAKPSGKILFELPSFVRNISSTSAGAVDQHTGTVTLAPDVHHVTVTLRRAP